MKKHASGRDGPHLSDLDDVAGNIWQSTPHAVRVARRGGYSGKLWPNNQGGYTPVHYGQTVRAPPRAVRVALSGGPSAEKAVVPRQAPLHVAPQVQIESRA